MLRMALAIVYLLFVTACYRLPGDDEYSVIPTTNNPSVTGDKGSSLMPQAGF